ncbi:MAG: hypothetical protein ACRDE6_05940 [Candidatus Limnocylindria bacterium]
MFMPARRAEALPVLGQVPLLLGLVSWSGQVPEAFFFLEALAVVAVDFALLVFAFGPVAFEVDPRAAALFPFDVELLREAAVLGALDAAVEGAVDRRAADFLLPIGRASPTALMAPPATSPTVPAILPAVLPTFFITLPASGIGHPPCMRRGDACAMPIALCAVRSARTAMARVPVPAPMSTIVDGRSGGSMPSRRSSSRTADGAMTGAHQSR